MEKKTYVVAICGCDDTSYAIFEDLTENELVFLERLQTKINWFSTYSCQPTIYITAEPNEYHYCQAFEEVKKRTTEEQEEAERLEARKKEWRENCKF